MPLLTKEQAFVHRPDERFVPVVGRQFNFTRRWFHQRNCCTFSTFLPPRFDGTTPVNLLQIGVFEGMDLVWQLQNTLKHPDSFAVGLDPWAKTGKLSSEEMSKVKARAESNTSSWSNKVRLEQCYSQQRMAEALESGSLHGVPTGSWDLIVIDGNHDREPVFTDAVHSLLMARVGGWLLFDDVHQRIDKKDHVKEGLADFLGEYGTRVRPVWAHRFCECYEKLS